LTSEGNREGPAPCVQKVTNSIGNTEQKKKKKSKRRGAKLEPLVGEVPGGLTKGKGDSKRLTWRKGVHVSTRGEGKA